MGDLYNQQYQTQVRKLLRYEATHPEKVLWRELKGGKLGVKFRRQFGIDRYVVDFYCPIKKLAIEIDGGYHNETRQKGYDETRDEIIEVIGITVMHFTNKEICSNLNQVINKIRQKLKGLKNTVPPSLKKGRGTGGRVDLTKLILVCLIISVGLVFTGLECPPKPKGQEEEITLTWWRVNFDQNKDLEKLIGTFETEWPNIKIELRTFTFAEYEAEVVDAISASTAGENKGPDIVSIHDDWLPRWQDRLLPIPESTEIFEHTTFREYADSFVEVAVDELTTDQQVYAVPLYLDTLALYYNKDLFDSAGVTTPPENWTEFSEAVTQLTKIDNGEIIQSGAAIGTSTNINRSTDILELLMLQNGTKMINDDHDRITFDAQVPSTDGKQVNPGQIATTYYTDFANAKKEIYTWNLSQDYSIDAFVAGKTAMMFNYAFRQDTLDTKSPNLNYNIAPAPQVDPETNKTSYPNYWAEAVSNKTLYPDQAWLFVEHLAEYNSQKTYLDLTNRPPARRDIIDEVKNEPIMGIFAEQALTARSWWKPDNGQVEVIFAKMIESINLGKSTVEEAMSVAQNSIQQLIKDDK